MGLKLQTLLQTLSRPCICSGKARLSTCKYEYNGLRDDLSLRQLDLLAICRMCGLQQLVEETVLSRNSVLEILIAFILGFQLDLPRS